MIEIIDNYYREAPGGELRQKLMEKVCSTQIMDETKGYA